MWAEDVKMNLTLISICYDKARVIQGSFANCNISVDLDLFNGGISEYIWSFHEEIRTL